MRRRNFLWLLLHICVARFLTCSTWGSWGYFRPYMRPGAENAWNELPELIFNFMMCGQVVKIIKMSFLGLFFAMLCWGKIWKCFKWASWVYFWPYVRPGTENAQNELPGATFEQMCGQELKMLKISFLGLLLARCAARGWKLSKWASWDYSSPCCVWAKSENTSNELLGFIFCHMCGQELKVLKMSLLGLLLPIWKWSFTLIPCYIVFNINKPRWMEP